MTVDPTRWAWAALACGGWLCLWLPPWRRQWQAWRARRVPGQSAPLLIGFASQSGFGAQLAEHLARTLAAQGCPAQARALHSIRGQDIATAERMLFIASTTGDGDAPDNAAAFVAHVMQTPQRLERLRYGLLALGDRSYAGFCQFGRSLDAWLQAAGAMPAFTPIEADGGNPEALDAWTRAVAGFVGTSLARPAEPAPLLSAVQGWTLLHRRVLNPGSPGLPIHHLVLQPLDARVAWQAGDVARVWLPGLPAAWREYTLASLPQEGCAELLVREAVLPDGRRGLGSGWLGDQLAIGGAVQLQIRRNSSFHSPDHRVPLVLIGNGTGLAGLAAHLKARHHARLAGQQVGPAWLLFGERTRCCDALWDDALQAWRASGLLQRLDRAFSRDADASAHYVQDLLAQHGEVLRQWVDEGAALYVCGQRDGMAQDVHAALAGVLGAPTLEHLAASGRYRRDVY